MSIIVLIHPSEENGFKTDFVHFSLTSSQRIAALMINNKDEYPINLLRNLAIDKAETSHVFVCDLDFWPSGIIEWLANSILCRYGFLFLFKLAFLRPWEGEASHCCYPIHDETEAAKDDEHWLQDDVGGIWSFLELLLKFF